MAFFEKIGEKITNTVGGTTAKAKEMTEIQKLNSSVAQLKKSIDEKYAYIGKYYYDNCREKCDVEALNTACTEIDALLKELDETTVKLAEKKGQKKCEQCGEFIDNSNTFCPLCGGKQSVVVIKCVNCKTVLENGARFCPKCGSKQPEISANAAAPVSAAQSVVAAEESVQPAADVVESVEQIPVPVETAEEPVVDTSETEETAEQPVGEAAEAVEEEIAEEIIVEEVIAEPAEDVAAEPMEEKAADPVISSSEGIVPEFVPAGDVQPIESVSAKCPSCGAELDEDSVFCTECGAKLDSQQSAGSIFCSNCGNKEESGTSFCSECGSKL